MDLGVWAVSMKENLSSAYNQAQLYIVSLLLNQACSCGLLGAKRPTSFQVNKLSNKGYMNTYEL